MKIMVIIIYKKRRGKDATSMKPDVCLKCFPGIRPMTDKGKPHHAKGEFFIACVKKRKDVNSTDRIHCGEAIAKISESIHVKTPFSIPSARLVENSRLSSLRFARRPF